MSRDSQLGGEDCPSGPLRLLRPELLLFLLFQSLNLDQYLHRAYILNTLT